jgi:hypothetical protein
MRVRQPLVCMFQRPGSVKTVRWHTDARAPPITID